MENYHQINDADLVILYKDGHISKKSIHIQQTDELNYVGMHELKEDVS